MKDKIAKIAESVNKAVEKTLDSDLSCIICTKGTRTRGIHSLGEDKIIIYGLCPECAIKQPEKEIIENINLRIQSISLINKSKSNN